ncbi:release factor glutamine methyltransferase [Halovenus aranensis]|uniref:Release factor glutamine methyltransferase n=1 Tax=Halovenus aranensis TaxID=890420 RepID=A0A1G8W658_9EURY|nr:HemK2/MTQ2 family protein methyltransferase [Halovenus aranensis]SDJ73606.1 release factor glutamine methyltransferase [Halovenus aranensis]
MTDDEHPQLTELRELDQVYQPAEDSHLLASTAAADIDGGASVLDVGTGAGYVADYIREESGASVVGVDLNPMACEQARGRDLAVLRGDLVSPFRAATFDVVCFNPPYLPDAPEGVWDDWMEQAITGGEDGRAVIREFLADVGRVLRPDGSVYLLISTVTGLEDVRSLAADNGFGSKVIAEKSESFETLIVLRLSPE